MLPSLASQLRALLLCILISSVVVTHAARRSRVDTPVAKTAAAAAASTPTDEVLDDNVATASGSEPEVLKAEPLVAEKQDVPVTEALIADRADTDQEQLTDAPPMDIPTVEECEADNIGYEIVTG